MNISLRDAREMSWWEYQALVWNHLPEEDEEPAPPDPADLMSGASMLRNLGMVH